MTLLQPPIRGHAARNARKQPIKRETQYAGLITLVIDYCSITVIYGSCCSLNNEEDEDEKINKIICNVL